MSQHECPVVEVTARKHPNADNLGLVNVWGYQSVVQLKEFPLDKPTAAVFIPPDYVVPDTADWAFLNGHRRITTRKFRGERSEGIVIPNAKNLKLGTDAMGALGIVRWESPAERQEAVSSSRRRAKLPWWNWRRWYWAVVDWSSKRRARKCKPPVNAPKYDIEAYKRFPVIRPDEVVVATEKIHGCNARYAFINGRFYVGSHTLWKDPKQKNWWTGCAEQNPWIEALCRRNPGCIFYGEIYGASIQPLDYGVPAGKYGFRLFDIRESNGDWASWDRIEQFWFRDTVVAHNWVPVLAKFRFDSMSVELLAAGNTRLNAKHIREGVVVETWTPRTEPGLGRVKLKVINPAYLEIKHEGQEKYLKEHPRG